MIISATEAALVRSAISSAILHEESYTEAWDGPSWSGLRRNKEAQAIRRRTRGFIKLLRTLDRKIAERQKRASNAAPRA